MTAPVISTSLLGEKVEGSFAHRRLLDRDSDCLGQRNALVGEVDPCFVAVSDCLDQAGDLELRDIAPQRSVGPDVAVEHRLSRPVAGVLCQVNEKLRARRCDVRSAGNLVRRRRLR